MSAGSGTIDFAGLAAALLSQARVILPQWFPNGRFEGKEFVVGSRGGEAGTSLSINVETGAWSEFGIADGPSGGDMVSYYAYRDGIKNGEAAKLLAPGIGFNLSPNGAPKRSTNGNGTKPERVTVKAAAGTMPPAGAPTPDMRKHNGAWCYKNAAGEPVFWIARYNKPDGEKLYLPFTWDAKSAKWVNKAWPVPRPLFGLDLLAARPEAPVLICEGEKSAEAARTIVGAVYVAVSWPGGANGWRKVDWSPLKGRKVTLWPDADRQVLKPQEAA